MFKIRPWMRAAALAAASAATTAWAQTPIPPAASDFALMAAQSDEYEIQAGRTAAVQATDPRVRSFAEEMINEHTRTSQTMREAMASSGLQPPPPALSSDQARLLSALQSLRGAEFDRTYARQQVLAHDVALAVAQSYAGAGSDPNLRRAAQTAVPLIQHHLDMAQKLRAALGS